MNMCFNAIDKARETCADVDGHLCQWVATETDVAGMGIAIYWKGVYHALCS